MNILSSENLSLLPEPEKLQQLCKSISVLEAIICPEWQFRYYSYQNDWAYGEEVCTMRDGQGDQMLILFSDYGVCISGFAHESVMNGWREKIVKEKQSFFQKLFSSIKKATSELTQDVHPGVLDQLPESFNDFVFGEPVKSIGTTFCIWQTPNDDQWQIGDVVFPENEYKDGSSDLLQLLDGIPETYKSWAEDYYEEAFDGNELKLEIVESIYLGEVITAEMVRTIHPDQMEFDQLKSELNGFGYQNVL